MLDSNFGHTTAMHSKFQRWRMNNERERGDGRIGQGNVQWYLVCSTLGWMLTHPDPRTFEKVERSSRTGSTCMPSRLYQSKCSILPMVLRVALPWRSGDERSRKYGECATFHRHCCVRCCSHVVPSGGANLGCAVENQELATVPKR